MPIASLRTSTAVLTLPLLVLTGCPRDRERVFTLDEATLALEQASDASQAEDLTSVTAELATHFTLGAALSVSAAELRDFITSRLPCADVSVDDATLTVVYGAAPGACRFHGHTLEGTHVIAIERSEEDGVDVHHEWIGLSNGVVLLDGTADVSWSFADRTRRVKHTSQWTHVKSGRVGRGSGDRVQSLLEDGVEVDGERSWEAEGGRWELYIDSVQLRGGDPVPQAGRYILTTPFPKALAISFERLDDDTVRVDMRGPLREFTFDVSQAGEVTERP